MEIPPVTPELADGALRASLAEKQCGVFFCRVEVGRIDNPGEHLLVVGRLDPALLYLTHGELVEYLLVFERELFHLFALGVDAVNLVGLRHGVTHGDEAVLAHGSQRSVVVVAGGNLFDFLVETHAEDVYLALIGRANEERLSVGSPGLFVGAVIEVGREVLFFASCHVHDKEAVLVRFVTVALHAAPGHVFAVGREGRRGVVAHHALGEVAGLFRAQVIEVDVGVGRDGVFQPRLLAAGVGYRLAVGGPGKRLDTAEGFHGRLVGLALHDVGDARKLLTVERGNVGVRNLLDPLVPVFVHEVVDYTAGSLVEVGIDVRSLLAVLHVADEEDLFLVGREEESVDALLVVAYLPGVAAVGLHDPQLRVAALAREVGNLFAAVNPHGVALRLGGAGNLFLVLSVDVHHEELAVALVLLHILVGNPEEDFALVGRNHRVAHPAKGHEHLGSQDAVFDFHGLLADNVTGLSGWLTGCYQ